MAGPFSLWDIGGCNCAAGTVTQTFIVLGCDSLAYQSLTVSVYTAAGGTLLASGTTNSSGQVALSWTGTAIPYVTVTGQSARFATYGQTLTLTSGGSTTITLTAAAGYHCDPGSGCLLPIADTLFGTDSILGGATLAYQTSGAFIGTWRATTSYAYGGYTSAGGSPVWCFGGTVALTWRYAGGLLTVSFSCTAAGGNPICPAVPFATACTDPPSTTITSSMTCPASFLVSQSLTYNGSTTAADHFAALYGQMTDNGTALLWSITSGTTFATRSLTE